MFLLRDVKISSADSAPFMGCLAGTIWWCCNEIAGVFPVILMSDCEQAGFAVRFDALPSPQIWSTEASGE